MGAVYRCYEAIGIEKDSGYCEIAQARIANFKEKDIICENQQLELFARTG
jgi:DNA modification methylase